MARTILKFTSYRNTPRLKPLHYTWSSCNLIQSLLGYFLIQLAEQREVIHFNNGMYRTPRKPKWHMQWCYSKWKSKADSLGQLGGCRNYVGTYRTMSGWSERLEYLYTMDTAVKTHEYFIWFLKRNFLTKGLIQFFLDTDWSNLKLKMSLLVQEIKWSSGSFLCMDSNKDT